MSLKVKVDMLPIDELIDKKKIGKFSEGQKYIDSEILRLCSSRVPKNEGTLLQSGILNTDIGSGEVIYNTPYAAKQYYGIDYKHSEGRQAEWFEHVLDEGGREHLLDGLIRITGAKK